MLCDHESDPLAGLDADDFGLITTYEDYSCCKPNIEYFRTVLDELSLDPAECLMVGNDVEEDLVVRDLGVKTYLVTDTMEKRCSSVTSGDW